MEGQKQVCNYYVSTSECAKVIGVSYWTIRSLILSKKIEAVKINGQWKIPLSSVESLMCYSDGESVEYLQMDKGDADD